MIPPRKSNTRPVDFDAELYKARHAVENAFADIKRFRGFATRYFKLAVTYIELASLAAWYVSTTKGHRKASPHARKRSRSKPTGGTKPRQQRLDLTKSRSRQRE